jgi:riboflavin synthase
MFTGLVETQAEVAAVIAANPAVRLRIRTAELAGKTEIGQSVAVNGCCLTVVERDTDCLAFDAGEETLKRTNLQYLKEGDQVNLEPSLKVGDQLGGHYVTGHVDDMGCLHERVDNQDWTLAWFQAPARLMKQMVSKGSITVDGVSLTLVDVCEDRFSVALIPHTLAITSLGRLQQGDPVNLETDILAKYVQRQLEADTFSSSPVQ